MAERKYYKLRRHHAASLDRLLKRGQFRMFISNWIFYGLRAAIDRYRVLSEMRKAQEFDVEIVDGGREDVFCKNCQHLDWCESQNEMFKTDKIRLIEKVKGYSLNPLKADEEIKL